jgi:hypothetical protein
MNRDDLGLAALMTRCMVRPRVARRFDELVVSGLASMYPASHEGACVKLVHSDSRLI